MIIFGTVQGTAARKYPEFAYLIPIRIPLGEFQFRQERFSAYDVDDHSDACQSLPAHPTLELADYQICIGKAPGDRLAMVKVSMLPNAHTFARAPVVVLDVRIARNALSRSAIDEIVRSAFKCT